MKFATTLAEPSTNETPLDPIFANNIDGNLQTVFNDAITLTTANVGPAGGPKEFDYGLDFQTPYVYDPTAGNLLMDLIVTNGEGPLLLDLSIEPLDTIGFIWTGGEGVDSEVAAAGQLGGHALQFTVVPEPSSLSILLYGRLIFLRLCKTATGRSRNWGVLDRAQ